MSWRRWIYIIPLRLRSLFGRHRVEQDLDDELAFHLAMAASQHSRTGLADPDAERWARRELGGVAQIKEACRDALRMGWIDGVVRDARYALRSFRRSPVFTFVAMTSLAVGVGGNCAAFSWADALLLRPLAIPRPDRVVTVGSKLAIEGSSIGASLLRASYPEYVDVLDRSRSFEALGAYTGIAAGFATTRGATPMLTIGHLVSGNFLSVLGVTPQLGRAFRPEEDQVPGRGAVLILAHALWERQFGSDPAVLGRQVFLNDMPFTVIGVLPAWFTGVELNVHPDYYAPIMMWPRFPHDSRVEPLEARDLRYVTLKGRLKAGVDVAQARSELGLISTDLERLYPEQERGRVFDARTELENRIAEMPPVFTLNIMLMTLAAALLLVACANVAGLLASRAPVRAREMAVRAAMGAGRTRLIRQLLTESFLIAIVGGMVGLAAAGAAIRAFQLIRFPTDLPFAYSFRLDYRAVVFGLLIAVSSVLLFGLAPSVYTSRVDLIAVMKGTGPATKLRRRWARGILVVGQVAISVVLLVLALGIYRTFGQELGGSPGYRVDHLLMMTFAPSLVRSSDSDTRRFYEQLVARARSAPEVQSVALASSVPMQLFNLNSTTVVPEGYQPSARMDSLALLSAIVDEHYFTTMRIPIVRGRPFRVEDGPDMPPVAIMNEQAVMHYWPGQEPIGKRVRLIEGGGSSWVQIVGVAKTSKYLFLAEPPTEYLYLPYRQKPQSTMILLAESAGDPSGLVAPLRAVAQSIDPRQPIYDVRTMDEFYEIGAAGLFHGIIGTVAVMGTMGLALSIVGIYGLVAFSASRRTKEIGIRMAIGAGRAAVLSMILGQGVVLAIVGLAVGLVASIGAGRALQAAFPGGPNRPDYVPLMLIAPLVLLVTTLAAYIPAHRASRIDPMQALRYE